MLHLILSILGILITIFFVIGTHESAHFITARLLGVKVLRFSIGFGKTLFHWYDKKGTEYVLALIPLGGYVKMLDENEGTVPEAELPAAYNRQPFYKKFLIVLAGPLTNIICAFLLYCLIYMIGFTTVKPIIGEVIPNSIAAVSGLKPQQEIVKLDGKSIFSWADFVLRLIAHAGNADHIHLTVTNPPQTHTLDLKDWKLDALTPDPITSLGIKPLRLVIPLVIGRLKENSPAAAADLRLGDKIIAVNKKPMTQWEELISLINTHPNETFTFTVQRNNKRIDIPVNIGYHYNLMLQKSGYLGIAPAIIYPETSLRHVQYGPIAAVQHAGQQLYDFTYFNFLLIGKLITGKISLQSLGGPITIFDTAGDALNSGLVAFLSFLAFLSISIGVINLLPIPGLDGGHLFLQLIETILRRPIPEKTLDVLYRLGFLLVFFVLAIALTNDVLRLF